MESNKCSSQAAAGCGSGCFSAQPLAPDASPDAARAGAHTLHIPAMDCAAEESEIRHALGKIPGIASLQFRLSQRLLLIDAPADALPLVLGAIRKAGFEAFPIAAAEASSAGSAVGAATCQVCGHDTTAGTHSDHGHATGDNGYRISGALVLAVLAELAHFLAPDLLPWRIGGMALAVLAIALSGFSTYRKGLGALRHGRLSINALMTVAVSGAFLIGQWPEAAMVMALYAIAEWIEGRAADRARNAIERLLELAPDSAEVQQPDGSWKMQPVAGILPGAVLRVKAGERVALDGVVMQGQSAIDQASVTGESIPVDKSVGDSVFAGTVNTTGVLQVRSTATAQNTTLARIIQAVEDAQASRAPTQAFVDRFAAIYTPTIFALAIGTAVLGPLLLGWNWLDGIYKGLVLLVIGCPCALVIATPVTLVSALTAAARRGMLFKGGVHLEQARTIKAVAFDKTGTLTWGEPTLVHHEVFARHDQATGWALAMAQQSDHPVSSAIGSGLQSLQVNQQEVYGVCAAPGFGTQATASEGHALCLGHAGWMQQQGLLTPEVADSVSRQQALGRTVSLLSDGQQVLALFAVADRVRAQAADAIRELQELGVHTVMLSGDHQTTADAIAQETGLDQARGNLLPEDKLQAIAGLQRSHGPTAMVGDGINDAPALASSNLGVAMGGAGTHIAMEAADVVVLNDDLRRVPETIRLSHHTHRVLWQNIAVALGIKAVFFVLAIAGSATMWMAVFADMGASLLVVANGLRLLRWRG